jgi:hypothetical protein
MVIASLSQLLPLLFVVGFWLILFILTVLFFALGLNAPGEAEHEEEHEEHEAAGHDNAHVVEVDNQVPSTPGH